MGGGNCCGCYLWRESRGLARTIWYRFALMERIRLGGSWGCSYIRGAGSFFIHPAEAGPAFAKSSQYEALLSRPFVYRCFLVITAAVTEEVLYRSYAVGIGQLLFGSIWVACAVSVIAFTLAHFMWGLAHLVPVFVSAVVLTLLFVFTRNLWLCILAHAIVDSAGFLAVPAAARRRAKLGHNTS